MDALWPTANMPPHIDSIMPREFRSMFSNSRVLNYMSRLREEAPSGSDLSADEGVPRKGAGWRGTGGPMMVGVGYVSRELCDGQTLASPGRWHVSSRGYPESSWRL